MKIENIECRPLEASLPGYTGGTYKLAFRRTVQCRITTDVGIEGNVCVGNDNSYGSLFWELIRGPYKDLLVGADPLMVSKHWSDMMSQAMAAYADRSEIIKAASTIDTALWDLKGKLLGQPVYKLIGGVKDELPIIAIGGYYETSTTRDGIAQEVGLCKDAGLAGIKFKVGALSLAADAERVQFLREAAGEDFIIVVDSNKAWTPGETKEFARMIKELGVSWLEEPVHWRNELRGLRSAKHEGVPLASGQSEVSIFGCFELLAQECVDVINVTSNRGGGVTGWLKIAGAAELVDVQMAHVAEPHISMHLMAGIPNGTFVECYPDPRRDPFWAELYKDRPVAEGGKITLPDGPGFGLSLNEDALEFYASGPWV